MNQFELIGRSKSLLAEDVITHKKDLEALVSSARFLVLGGAGTIGQAVVKEIFKRQPKLLHVVDISENNLVELVRDIRSSIGYISGEFKTFTLDIGSLEYDVFMATQDGYDYVLNLSALKHVRSEKDPFTLMRMVETNVFNSIKTHAQAKMKGAKKYFSVSTDKAANPVNMMGASKRIMELFLMRESTDLPVSMARFANVAFSDGSLLHSFDMRLRKSQPIVAPKDIKRYFVTPEESGQICLMSCLLGDNLDIYFPKLDENIHLQTFSEIAIRYLKSKGFQPYLCESEEEARQLVLNLPKGVWPCLFSESDTSGEKFQEEFYTGSESLDLASFKNLGVIQQTANFEPQTLLNFEQGIRLLRDRRYWSKDELIGLFNNTLPEFSHLEVGRSLEEKM